MERDQDGRQSPDSCLGLTVDKTSLTFSQESGHLLGKILAPRSWGLSTTGLPGVLTKRGSQASIRGKRGFESLRWGLGGISECDGRHRVSSACISSGSLPASVSRFQPLRLANGHQYLQIESQKLVRGVPRAHPVSLRRVSCPGPHSWRWPSWDYIQLSELPGTLFLLEPEDHLWHPDPF